MKNLCLLFGLIIAVAAPSTGSAKLVLEMPPILAGQCSKYSGCSTGPCYPGCNDPCTPCNVTCQNYSGCSAGPCYPSCADPCTPCSNSASFNDTGITAHTATGDDSYYGRDTTYNNSSDGLAGFSFTKLDNSGNPTTGTAVCIKDNVTGLIWEVTSSATKTWSQASSAVSTFTACGVASGNWRLPTVKELMGIAAYSNTNPSIDGNFFLNTPSSTLWTATNVAGNQTTACAYSACGWGVNFIGGFADYTVQRSGTTALAVHFVSGSQTTESFVDNGDGTVTDSNRKLMWKKCPEGFTYSSNTCTAGATVNFTWTGALAKTGSTFAGHSDWRVPNIKELHSLVNEGYSSPAINSTYFPNNPTTAKIWSSSPSVLGTSASWYVDFTYGATLYQSRTTSLNTYVRLVRDAQ